MSTVLGGVEAGVVAQVHGGVTKILSEPRTIGRTRCPSHGDPRAASTTPRFRLSHEGRPLPSTSPRGMRLRETRAEARRLLEHVEQPLGSPMGCPVRPAHPPRSHSARPMPGCSGQSSLPGGVEPPAALTISLAAMPATRLVPRIEV